jgi:UDP-N-acetylmuramoyl-tripeptide--D-alanyl-D-alanine ligase
MMIRAIKQKLYFPIANYFKFWAKIQLNSWKPIIIVVTGSSGKTTLLHLIESQIGNKAKYSHHANSSYGIPFDILGLKRKKLTFDEWLSLFLLAPFKAFKPKPKEAFYIVEADCDRPGEGSFLADLLNPEVILWINSGLTHSGNFDWLVENGQFTSVQKAITNEFGQFLKKTKKLAIVNGDNSYILDQVKSSKTPTIFISKKDLKEYKINKNSTEFVFEDKKYTINFIVPKNVFYSIEMTFQLLKYLKIKPDDSFAKFILAPGRSTIFEGVKNTTIIDSTYNATPDGMGAILQMFEKYPLKKKWLVLGDMIELGNKEKEEHEKLGIFINSMDLEKIILIGPRLLKYTYPKIKTSVADIKNFTFPKDGLDYISKNIKGKEVMLFKGARFLEGIIEHLLRNKEDISKLVRREIAWQNRRREWGL